MLWAGEAWACSGPGAREAIDLSFQIAAATWLASLLVAVLVFALRRLRPHRFGFRAFWAGLPLLQTLLVLTLGVTRGDCGFLLRSSSLVIASVLSIGAAAGAAKLS